MKKLIFYLFLVIPITTFGASAEEQISRLAGTWIVNEYNIWPDDDFNQAIGYIRVRPDGSYTSHAYNRKNSEGCNRFYGPWYGQLEHLSDNVYIAWNDPEIYRREAGYLVVFNQERTQGSGTLMGFATATEKFELFRTDADPAVLIEFFEQYTCDQDFPPFN
jgi:hypothetical protein